jgi:hypothetical protein
MSVCTDAVLGSPSNGEFEPRLAANAYHEG